MGAGARSWLRRALVVLAAMAGVALLLWLPAVPAWAKVALLALAALSGGVLAWREIPAFDPLGRVRWRLPRRRERACAITFDDGPSASTPRVLEVLARCQVKATFFVLAANARRHPEVLRLLAARGHTVAVHGVEHKKLHRASAAAVEHELKAATAELSALGVPPARLYRPPHGCKSMALLRVAHRLGFEVWAWSRGIWDTDRPDPEILVRRATRFACSRMVLLLHDGRGNEAQPDIEPMLAALPRILEGVRAAGFTFVTLDRA
jgi:peptidoglycan/xylan/chitin deacetylase (PgdA/CDA1 family)